MAQKAITEYYGKKLIFAHLREFLPTFEQAYQGVVVTEDNLAAVKLPKFTEGYVTKPDQLFGKRGKNGLVYSDKSPEKIKNWIKAKMNKEVKILRSKNDKGVSGVLHTFIIEPYIGHEEEYYIAFKTEREHDVLYFSNQGGIDVEKNWREVTEIKIPFELETKPLSVEIKSKLADAIRNKANQKLLVEFISALHQVFRKLDFTYLEINPLAVKDGQIYLLDLVARLDDTALYKNYQLWHQAGEPKFPPQFGSSQSEAEKKIRAMDEKTGASLKFLLLNPNGRIWLLSSSGGASIVLTDTVGDLGFGKDLANYGEYSGNPTTDETAEYTKAFFDQMFKSKAKDKVLIIAGGIANFTDIKNTFLGVVQGIKEYAQKIKQEKIKIFVRRGGPNYKAGLQHMRDEVGKLGIPIEVYGPEMYMTEIINLALKKKS